MSKRVIVVEDNDNIRNIVHFILSKQGFAVDTAADGDQALQKIRSGHYDIVLLDVMLPGMSGFDICTEIKEDPRLHSTKVVMMTAIAKDSGKSDEYWRQKVKADGFISKPFKGKDLLDKVVELIGQPAVPPSAPAAPGQPQ